MRNKLKLHSLALSSLQCTIARCRSHISWLNEGDANTAMFHSFARYRKRKNFISKLVTDEGEVLTKHEDKEQNIFNFYNTLLGECADREVTVNLEELHLPRFILWIWTTLSRRRKFGKQLGPCLQTKPQDRMASQGNSIRCASQQLKLISWQQFLLFGAENWATLNY